MEGNEVGTSQVEPSQAAGVDCWLLDRFGGSTARHSGGRTFGSWAAMPLPRGHPCGHRHKPSQARSGDSLVDLTRIQWRATAVELEPVLQAQRGDRLLVGRAVPGEGCADDGRPSSAGSCARGPQGCRRGRALDVVHYPPRPGQGRLVLRSDSVDHDKPATYAPPVARRPPSASTSSASAIRAKVMDRRAARSVGRRAVELTSRSRTVCDHDVPRREVAIADSERDARG